MRNLDLYQGRRELTGLPAMFREGFRAGRTREEDQPRHFVRIGGFTQSHDATGLTVGAGLDCVGCMAVAARQRQWVESLRLHDQDPPSHEY